jgi:hypothetical protein
LKHSNPNSKPKTYSSRPRPKFYPRHFKIYGKAMLGKAVSINNPRETPRPDAGGRRPGDELIKNDLVVFGLRDAQPVKIKGKLYYITYRNRLAKVDPR